MKKNIINRVWTGKIKAKDINAYKKYVEETGINHYREIPGNISAKISIRIENNICHFLTVTEWESIEAIKKFAGTDYEKARYYPEDENYLLEFKEYVKHYETTIYE